jgi:hypothetical protein
MGRAQFARSPLTLFNLYIKGDRNFRVLHLAPFRTQMTKITEKFLESFHVFKFHCIGDEDVEIRNLKP